jgi:chromate reductase
MNDHLNFVAFSGSLRKGSYNSGVLRVLQKIAPENMGIEELFFTDVPIYNADLHHPVLPAMIEVLNDQIIAADGVIIVTPEYNHSVPGGLKNMIDHISRSAKQPFNKKPVGILGASPGMMGTERSQNHLRTILSSLNAYMLNFPEVFIAQAPIKFDNEGNMTDQETISFLKTYLQSLIDFSLIFKGK